ncbi:VacJ family lipoprotein [Porphyrobacter sp. AAP82]|uniref:MlaA family lipoprotein n=1 Tax=Porphyrobacter sp. AAP82 TaxID=1248917 RepID=UPI00030DB9B8|nr:VacJ family lipoprotein [Porphyrobacter sp. AAP82]
MPGFVLLATSPALMSAAIGYPLPDADPATPPHIALDPGVWSLAGEAETPERRAVLPLGWSLAAAQDAARDQPPPPDGAPPVGEIVVEGEVGPPKSDPAEAINEESYRVTQAVDAAVVEPVANAYRDALPDPVRDGLGNVVRNLGEPSVALNFLLQGKVGKAAETLGRLAINSTLGVGGLFDVAEKRAGLPYRRNGFANTMGFYGIGSGPYLYLPVTGATSLRDLVGSTLDQALLPVAVGDPFNRIEYAATYFLINGLDQRLAFDEEIASIRASDDPYRLRRETYLAQRRRDIAQLKGAPISERDRMWLEELEALKAETGTAPPPETAPPVEPPANPDSLAVTRTR